MSSQGTFDPLLVFDELGLKKGDRLMDAGCGTGYMSMIASRMVGPTGSILALDEDEWSLDILMKRVEFGSLKNIMPKVHDITKPIDIDLRPYDHILLTNVMHGFILNYETDHVMDFLNDHIKDEGQICVIDFKKQETEMGPPVDHRIDRDQMISIFKDNGLIAVKVLDLSPSHYMLIFQKDRV